MTLDYGHYLSPGRDAYLYPETHNERLNLSLELTVVNYVYVNPTVVSLTTSNQFRLVGLQYEIGVHVASWLDVYKGHESLHLLDREQTMLPGFPLADWIGFRFNLFTSQKPNYTILP